MTPTHDDRIPKNRSFRLTFPGHNGNDLAARLELPPDEPKLYAIFSHCFTCTKDIKAISRISKRLAQLGIAVLRYDFSGLGQSKGNFTETSFSTNKQDLLAAAKFLSENYNPPQLLIGMSLGGAASLATAAQIDSVTGVVTLAAPSETPHLAETVTRFNPKVETEGEGKVTIGGTTYLMKKKLLDDLRSYDLGSDLVNLTQKVLLFHSPLDQTLGYEHAQTLKEKIGTNASLVTLHGADHLLTTDPSDIEFVAQTIFHWTSRFVS
ncbi:MAG: alpha/beta hydrolase [Pirellulaceae bacterium]|nr:alpha/beta hydrolase [Pirellulaceae bacterium]